MKRAFPILRIFCLLVTLAANSNASDTPLDRETLRDVKSLYVIVSVPSNDGLNGSRIHADAVDRLRSAGISVIDLNRSALLLPCLLVSANILKRQDGSWVYEVSVSLNQAVTIVAKHSSYMASTWSVSTLAFASGSDAPGFVRSDVNNLVDKFIRVYLGVNRP
jgi:hypothetical protein